MPPPARTPTRHEQLTEPLRRARLDRDPRADQVAPSARVSDLVTSLVLNACACHPTARRRVTSGRLTMSRTSTQHRPPGRHLRMHEVFAGRSAGGGSARRGYGRRGRGRRRALMFRTQPGDLSLKCSTEVAITELPREETSNDPWLHFCATGRRTVLTVSLAHHQQASGPYNINEVPITANAAPVDDAAAAMCWRHRVLQLPEGECATRQLFGSS